MWWRKEFRLAQLSAMNIIVYMDHLLDLVQATTSAWATSRR